jgi:two-component system, chemotaxis family, protein-glutamate methylesterase/glutaminase
MHTGMAAHKPFGPTIVPINQGHTNMQKRNIIVIGASAGGVLALSDFFRNLPRDMEAYYFVVLHISPFSPSILPQILSRVDHMKAIHPKDGEAMQPNKIYIAPPDHHLLLDKKERIIVRKGPKENRFRPSVDALFRSAAYSFGARVIGIVLSGMLDDGTSGLWTVKRLGGVAIIQDPNEAEFPSMPENVLEYVEVDHVLPVTEMGNVLSQLTKDTIADNPPDLSELEEERLRMEVHIARQDNAFEMRVLEKGEATHLVCPECSGSLVRINEGKIIRYRCHTGHGYSDNALLASVTKGIEENLWRSVRGLEEAIIILEQSAQKFEAIGNANEADIFYKKALDAHRQAQLLRQYLFEQERFSNDTRFDERLKDSG